MNKKLVPLFVIVSLEMIFLICFHYFYAPYGKNINTSSEIYWISSDRIISSVELNSTFLNWTKFDGKRKNSQGKYAYVKIIIENSSREERNCFVLNRDFNSSSVLMEFRKFQMFPIDDDYPFVNKSVFKISVPAGTKKTYFLEMKNFGPVAISPVVLNEEGFFAQLTSDQIFLWIVIWGIAFFSLYLIAEYFVIKKLSLLLTGVTALLVDAVYFVQAGFAFNFFAFSFFLFAENEFLVPGVSFLYIAFLILTLFYFVWFLIRKNLIWITTFISFVPWFIFGGIGCVSKLHGIRVFYEQLVPMSFMISLVIYGIFIIASYNIMQNSRQEELLSYFTLNSKVYFPDILKEKSIPAGLLVKVRNKLQQPLEIIQVVSSMIMDTTDHTKIVAYSSVISDYVTEMKKILGLNFIPEDSTMIPAQSAPVPEVYDEIENQEFVKFKDVAICIYGKNDESSITTKVILNGYGFFCVQTDSAEQIVAGIERGEFQMLVIDPAADKSVFELCRRIRSRFNLLQFPILMIINFFANYLVRSGYLAGVNDFVIRPFDSSELISRCYSLLRQKNVFEHNKELSRQENEKSTFLYFVTHNVNTPLTLLLNRIEEFSVHADDMDTERQKIFRDIKDGVMEINEIIQNVLISFRISDGRYANVPEKLFVEDILDFIKPTMESRAETKNVKIVWDIPGLLPQVNCNRQAVKGILTNLIDNAIKYSPENGTVTIQISLRKSNASEMVLKVSDEGDGIPNDKVPYLFTRFEKINSGSAKNWHTVGLGLYVANELAKLNDIRLMYSDAIGGGACFSVVFRLDKFLPHGIESLPDDEIPNAEDFPV